jgi:carbon monoxide dehydrogenase subunit G
VVIGGTREFAAPRERVWDLLVDPHVLADFLPGLESLQVADPTHWSACMRMPRSPVTVTLDFELTEHTAPEHALLEARGKKLGASVEVRTAFDLTDAAGATAMAWSADVALGGMLGKLEPGLRPVAQQQAERFLDGLDRRLKDAA